MVAICLAIYMYGNTLSMRTPLTCQTTVLRETRKTETLLQMPAESPNTNMSIVPAPLLWLASPATAPMAPMVKIESSSLVRETLVNCLALVAVKEE